MKKILALGLMFMAFAPFNASASCYSDGTNWVSSTTGAACAFDADGVPYEVGGSVSTDAPSGGSASTDSGLSGGAGNVSLLYSFLGAAINDATKLILGAAVVFFLWGVFNFVKNADNDEERAKGKNQIVWGIVGIAVMVSMWGLVTFVTKSAGLDTTTTYKPPALMTQ